MPRIRTVKPEFHRSLTLAKLSRDARLCFIGLLNFADDSGRGIADPRLIKGDLFPYDEDVSPILLTAWLSQMDELGLIVLYRGPKDEPLYAIKNWVEHQRVNNPTPSRWPSYEDSRRITVGLPESYLLERKGKEGKGGEVEPPPSDPEVPAVILQMGAEYFLPGRERRARLNEVRMILDGMRGVPPTPEVLASALADMLGRKKEWGALTIQNHLPVARQLAANAQTDKDVERVIARQTGKGAPEPESEDQSGGMM